MGRWRLCCVRIEFGNVKRVVDFESCFFLVGCIGLVSYGLCAKAEQAVDTQNNRRVDGLNSCHFAY